MTILVAGHEVGRSDCSTFSRQKQCQADSQEITQSFGCPGPCTGGEQCDSVVTTSLLGWCPDNTCHGIVLMFYQGKPTRPEQCEWYLVQCQGRKWPSWGAEMRRPHWDWGRNLAASWQSVSVSVWGWPSMCSTPRWPMRISPGTRCWPGSTPTSSPR